MTLTRNPARSTGRRTELDPYLTPSLRKKWKKVQALM